jgi:hypothetical protein
MKQLAEEPRASWWDTRSMALMTLFEKQDPLDSALDSETKETED